MAGLVAKCTNLSCGHAFTSNLIDLGPGSHVDMRGNAVSCPSCGSKARILDGEFRVGSELDKSGREVIEVLSAPRWTYEVLRDLQLLIEEIVTSDVEDPIVPLLEHDMVLGTKLQRATKGWTREQKIALLSFLVGLIGLFVSTANIDIDIDLDLHVGDSVVNEGLTPEQLDELVNESVRRVREEEKTAREGRSKPTGTRPTPDEQRRQDPTRP
jgi:hypothetical protein